MRNLLHRLVVAARKREGITLSMHTAFRYNFGTLAVRGSLACLTVRYDFDGHTFAIRIHNTVFCKQMQDHLGHCSTHGRLRSGDMAP